MSELLAALDEADAVLARIDAAREVEMAPWAEQLALLQTIPGIGVRAAQTIIAETGGDMSRFPTTAALASWAGVCPGVHESAGRRGPARRRHRDKWLCSALVEAAHSVARSRNTYLASQYARIAGRRGSGRAAMAVAHSLLVIAYHVLDRGEPYRELGPDYLTRRHTGPAHVRRLVRQLEQLGHKVTLDPADPAA